MAPSGQPIFTAHVALLKAGGEGELRIPQNGLCLWLIPPAPSKEEPQLDRNLKYRDRQIPKLTHRQRFQRRYQKKEAQWPSVSTPSCPQRQAGTSRTPDRIRQSLKAGDFVLILKMRTQCSNQSQGHLKTQEGASVSLTLFNLKK